jgi:hypothetical protein
MAQIFLGDRPLDDIALVQLSSPRGTVGLLAVDKAIVSAPSHPFWSGRQIPFVPVQVTDQARFDFRLPRCARSVAVARCSAQAF